MKHTPDTDRDWVFTLISISILVIGTVILSWWLSPILSHMKPDLTRAPDRDRAHFMLECVGQLGYLPSTCEKIWDGENPPAEPNGCICHGC